MSSNLIPLIVALGCARVVAIESTAAEPARPVTPPLANAIHSLPGTPAGAKFLEFKVQSGQGWNEAVAAYAAALGAKDKNVQVDLLRGITEGAPICRVATHEDPSLLVSVASPGKGLTARFQKLQPGDLIFCYIGDSKEQAQPGYSQQLLAALRHVTPEAAKQLQGFFNWKSQLVSRNIRVDRRKIRDAVLNGKARPTISYAEARKKLVDLRTELLKEMGQSDLPGRMSVLLGQNYSASTLVRDTLKQSTSPASPRAAEVERALLDFYSAYNEDDVTLFREGDRMTAFYEKAFAAYDADLAKNAETRARFIQKSKSIRAALDDLRILRAAENRYGDND